MGTEIYPIKSSLITKMVELLIKGVCKIRGADRIENIEKLCAPWRIK